jgi:hypothetical protein
MNPAHWHLLLNHVPVVGLAFSILLLISSLIMKNRTLALAGLVAVVLSALMLIPVYLTGEPAEEVIENTAGVNPDPFLEEHEEAAEPAMIAMQILGAAALIVLFLNLRAGKYSPALTTFITISAIIVFFILGRVALVGGDIRHTEIRDGISGQTVSPVEDHDD